eukprot:scaffold416765_cov17-Prasinocladus_malaysianus.AAC.1
MPVDQVRFQVAPLETPRSGVKPLRIGGMVSHRRQQPGHLNTRDSPEMLILRISDASESEGCWTK